jgi:hypothetical protein
MAKWIELAKFCKDANSDCLAKAIEQKLQKPSYSYLYNAVVVDTNNGQTKEASNTDHDMITRLIQWDENSSMARGSN